MPESTATLIDLPSIPSQPDKSGTAGARGRRRRGDARVRPESLQSLAVYSQLVATARPTTARELLETTGLRDGTLYPILAKRVEDGLLTVSELDGVAAYTFTERGYIHARDALSALERTAQEWFRAERTFVSRSSIVKQP